MKLPRVVMRAYFDIVDETTRRNSLDPAPPERCVPQARAITNRLRGDINPNLFVIIKVECHPMNWSRL